MSAPINPQDLANRLQQRLQAGAPSPVGGMSPQIPSASTPSTFDPKGLQGILARGNAIYPGGAQAPQNAGRPRNPTPMTGFNALPLNSNMMKAIQERLRGYTTRAADRSRSNRTRSSGL